MENEGAAERLIGPFKYDEAIDYIKQFALALTNLNLQNRFTIRSTPRAVVEREKRWDHSAGRRNTYYQVVLVDRNPHEPSPEGLTALDIKVAEAAGYTKAQERTRRVHEAFGQSMTVNGWARAAGVSPNTLRSRISAGMTMEEAITQIALKKAS